jgi:hypothetical protein
MLSQFSMQAICTLSFSRRPNEDAKDAIAFLT